MRNKLVTRPDTPGPLSTHTALCFMKWDLNMFNVDRDFGKYGIILNNIYFSLTFHKGSL